MATEFVFLSGTAKWAKVRKPDKYGKYTIDLYVDPKTLKQARSAGVRVEQKEDEDGVFLRLKRDPEKLFDGMPERPAVHIWNPDEDKYVAFEGLIGNGSQVTVKVAVYDTVRGKGHRFEGVGVDKLVPYESASDSDLPF